MLGPMVKHLNVATNDPATPNITFTINAEVRRLIEIMPPSAGFGRVMDNEVRQQTVTLTNRANIPMQATLKEPTKSGNFEAELVETIPGFEFKLFVVLRPPFKEGNLGTTFSITTNIPQQATLTISTMAIILPRREVMPNVLYLADPSSANYPKGKPVTKVLEFLNHEPKPIHLMEALCSDPAVKVTLREAEPGRLYRILAQFPADYRMSSEGQTIKLVTNVADTPEIDVPVRMTGAVTKSPNAPATTNPSTPPQKPVMALIGKEAPALSLKTAAGLPVNNAEFKFHPATVLNFVSPECPFCKRQIPQVELLRAEYEPKGVRFVNVSESLHGKSFTQAEAQLAYDALGSHSELAMDKETNQLGNVYKIGSFPILVVVAKDGTIVDALPGARTENTEKLRSRLDTLLQKESGAK
jgi:thiol-disulfide isomerase/thioredoxin